MAARIAMKSRVGPGGALRAPPPPRRGVGQDHAAHHREPVFAQEHVLGAAQPDALGPECAGVGCILAGVGVGPHRQVTGTISSAHFKTVAKALGGEAAVSGT